MELITNLMKPNNQPQLILLVILILYIIFNIQTPHLLATIIDNIYGNIAVLVFAVYLLTNYNPLLGVVSLYAAYELIQRSSITTGSATINKYLPSQFKTDNHLSAFNQFPVTLEEEMVKQMAPLIDQSNTNNLNYVPVSDKTYDAMSITDTTSVI